MFSLIITIISVALVAALALATLYYGGDAYESGQAKSEAAKLRNQGQQLVAAAEFYYLQKGQWPETIQKMVDDGFLTTVPVAQRTAIQEAVAGKAWVMPVQRQPLFTYDEVTSEVCSTLNQDSYGLKGILPKLQPGYMHQCFGPTKNDLLVVVGRGSLPDLVAAANVGLLVPENVSSDPIPDPSDTAAWTVPPGETGDNAGGDTGEPGDPGDVGETDPPPTDPEPLEPGVISFSPTSVNMGSVATHFSAQRDVLVNNVGGQPVSLGVPALSGDPAFTISETTCEATLAAGTSCRVTVSYSPVEVSAEQTATLTVAEGASVSLTASAFNPVSLQSASLPIAKLNKVYTPVSFSSYFNASNEVTPDVSQIAWELQGALPTGLSFDSQTGTLSGTPTQLTAQAGQDFTVLATYKNNQGQQVYTIRVNEATLEVTQISAGLTHSCAVTPEGAAKCWGNNQFGQLGNNSNTNSWVPVTAQGLTSGVRSISVGDQHTCAGLATGVKCWGINTYGQLGDNSATNRKVPTSVVGISSEVSLVELGQSHSCALLSSGELKCWGWNGNGQLGDNSTTNKQTAVTPSGMASGVRSVAAGARHTCAVTAEGAAKCWGYNAYGQLGDNTTTHKSAPVSVQGLSSGVASVTTSLWHTCALTTSGGVKCWGLKSNGQLGDGSVTQRNAPVNVTSLGSGVVSLSAGFYHSCAVTDTGGALCWGGGNNGKLGDGTATERRTPYPVNGLSSGVLHITAGGEHTCAATTSGTKCWGLGTYGRLGTGTDASTSLPTNVME